MLHKREMRLPEELEALLGLTVARDLEITGTGYTEDCVDMTVAADRLFYCDSRRPFPRGVSDTHSLTAIKL